MLACNDIRHSHAILGETGLVIAAELARFSPLIYGCDAVTLAG